MAKRITEALIRSAPDGIITDAATKGLRLKKQGGRAYWILRVQQNGKRHELGLGNADALTPEQARAEADRRRAALEQGKATKKQADAQAQTLSQVIDDFWEAKRGAWTTTHARLWRNQLRTHCKGLLEKDVAAISTADVKGELEALFRTKPATARKVLNRLHSVLGYAGVLGLRTGDNPAAWAGHLQHVMPANGQSVEHMAADDLETVQKIARALAQAGASATRDALLLVILTACRANEVLEMTWSEVDLDTGVISIPAERMKSRRPHRVPLSPPAVELMKNRPKTKGTDLVFPGPYMKGPMRSRVLLELYRDSGGRGTIHGLRSVFRNWASAHAPWDVVELSLAHAVGDGTVKAYYREDRLSDRAVLIEQWSTEVLA